MEERRGLRLLSRGALRERYEAADKARQETELALQVQVLEQAERQQRQLLEERKTRLLADHERRVAALSGQCQRRQAEDRATRHHALTRLRLFGWDPWRRLLAAANDQRCRADRFAASQTVGRVWFQWRAAVAVRRTIRRIVTIFRVVTLMQYIRLCMKRVAFGKLRMNARAARLQTERAADLDRRHCLRKALRRWQWFLTARREERAEAHLQRLATLEHSLTRTSVRRDRLLVASYFAAWRMKYQRREDERLRAAFRKEAWGNVKHWLDSNPTATLRGPLPVAPTPPNPTVM